MATYLGVDWASSCWTVVKAGDETTVTTEPSILNVWHQHGMTDDVEAILVDIPIGLPETGPRACDDAAAEFLGARGNSVFSVPGREVVYTDEYDKAKSANGDSLGSQSWWLFPRIQEVDVFLQEYDEAVAKVYESHPEICFAKLAHGAQLGGKTTEEGRNERIELLRDQPDLYERVRDVVDRRAEGAEWHDRISKGRLDDVVDAAVLAYTARRLELGARSSESEYPSYPADRDACEDSRLGISPEILHPGTPDNER